MYKLIAFLLMLAFLGCQTSQPQSNDQEPNVDAQVIATTIKQLQESFPGADATLIQKGVTHAGSLWRAADGTAKEFSQFCMKNYFSASDEKKNIYLKLEQYLETINGHFTLMGIGLNKNVTLNNGPLAEVDKLFASYNAAAHWMDDLYKNKIAFVIALNFPYYSLNEKESLGQNWSAEEWGYARLGDVFAARVPAELTQNYSKVNADADLYISEYNIFMGSLVNDQNQPLFPSDMVLLTHWNLRDEIKSNYADARKGSEKQEMVYQVMKRIIDQTIPTQVINSGMYQWNPYSNKISKDQQEVAATDEKDARYQQIINNFKALQAMDVYNPAMKTYIERNFSGGMEISQPEVEILFDEFLSSLQVKEVAGLIKQRLGRELRPYDIWYDGFKARSSISAEVLDQKTQANYPDPKAFEADMPRMLQTLGWEKERAQFLASKITVEPARGSGHALGAEMHDMKSYLRTRIPETGMNYKGYNIAVHEFGHNVEQTITLHNVPYYTMHGVPNTAFTEALAFIFQSRDLKLLGMNDPDPDKDYLKTLDTFWSIYEIMGVSMVDMQVWKWLYEHPEATAAELREAVITISKEVWNKYYAPVFGSSDETVLAIYSHMIAYPLYLSAYSFGHLIDFQIEQHLKGKNFAVEVERIYSLGRLTPQLWMQKAVGVKISNQPILLAADEAVAHFKK
ncbi:MAG TPA: hypothetical protein DCQ26_18970 [Marinilabiliales bacterium]|nr:MAG: hypothetical protein A2W95_12220 [Bacteroidetes bacterium GWA2_40_14]OFX73479.1 MAG: hypothetical protein A2W96_11025 [Bacteroidetes bacterium GWD2_40_43]OFX90621.1 MAG: hypothetical protein A2W97_02505 [Bacteroidetes bacterium GWE2_40_63]OFY20902.1 MAG: hypothetical protein A2W88_17760 [Bacteroidetes bacterium GWF2_40_13]OFZ23679.1 MAG: hypothetical protein A2437_06480 [Bacteroidetes bacterium RIFOXYC2_FULL_40_12]HAN00682.1 hypothetical protein [Marinilabiliales bacterium]